MAERDTVDGARIAWIGVAILAAIVLAAGIAWIVMVTQGADPAGASAARKPAMPSPALQTAAPLERKAFYAEKRRQLETYGWIDRARGRVHIPIERAMELLVQAPE